MQERTSAPKSSPREVQPTTRRFTPGSEVARSPRFRRPPSAERAEEDRERRQAQRAIASWLRSLEREGA